MTKRSFFKCLGCITSLLSTPTNISPKPILKRKLKAIWTDASDRDLTMFYGTLPDYTPSLGQDTIQYER